MYTGLYSKQISDVILYIRQERQYLLFWLLLASHDEARSQLCSPAPNNKFPITPIPAPTVFNTKSVTSKIPTCNAPWMHSMQSDSPKATNVTRPRQRHNAHHRPMPQRQMREESSNVYLKGR